MLNLTKIHQIHKILRHSVALNLYKFGAEQVVTPALLDRYKQGDADAANIIAQEILKHIHGAMKVLGIMEMASPQEWKDFRDKTAMRIWDYSVPRYNPDQAKFNTFVFNMVDNMWKNWLKQKATTPLDIGRSLDDPLGEDEGATQIDKLKDPLALDFQSEVEAQIIQSALLENIENPRHQELLSLWLDEDPRMGPTEKRKAVTEKYNMAHPEEIPLKEYRVYRIMLDEIYPKVLDMFPERARTVDYIRNPEVGVGDPKWIRKPKDKLPFPEESTELIESTEESYIPLEERVAPVYRIDPQTGERVLISLNMKRIITASQEMRCYNLLTFLSIERYGKYKRILKSTTKREENSI